MSKSVVLRPAHAGNHALCLLLMLGFLQSAIAQPYRVGSDAACDFNNIQAAINFAESHSGSEEIHIAQNATYTAQALRITAPGDLDLIGGYGDCNSTVTSGRTTLSGAGGAADSVLVITGNGNHRLRNLNIVFGDETAAGKGGGIDFAGSGLVILSNLVINQNSAGFGGGISFAASGGPATLRLEEAVVVQDNIAQNSGGGIRIEGNAKLEMLGANSSVVGNEARGIAADSGYGGGLQVLAPATAEIATPGRNNIATPQGAISSNRAKYGGGIAVQGRVPDADSGVLVHNSDQINPTRIDNNIATVAGGGVYLEMLDSGIGGAVTLCASSFRVDHNRAPDGAAFFLDGDFFDNVQLHLRNGIVFTCPDNFTPSTSCSSVDCNSIDGNRAVNDAGQLTGGAIVKATPGAIHSRRVTWRGNEGGDLIYARAFGNLITHWLELYDSVITDNALSGQAIYAEDSPGTPDVSIRNVTVAGNTLGLSTVMTLLGQSDIQEAIIWQPGKSSLGASHGALTGQHIISNDPASLAPPLIRVVNRDPRFVDPGFGNYRLRAASPAVDFAPAVPNGPPDRDQQDRDLDLPNADAFGPRDLGAYERQSVPPILLNGNFVGDLRHWTAVGTPNVSSFDSSQLLIDWQGPGPIVFSQLEPRTQCVHLPVAGRYVLAGLARVDTSNGNADIARLRWEFRRNGGESCTSGPVDGAGELTLNSGVNAFLSERTDINVFPEQWTSNSSITLYTTLVNGGTGTIIRGWFDTISLDYNGDINQLFKDSFE
jgi:hypothetical protein